MTRAHLYGLVAGLCILNALVRPIQDQVLETGLLLAAMEVFGLNLVVLLSCGVGLLCFVRASDQALPIFSDWVVVWGAAILLLVPLATVAWATLMLAMLGFLMLRRYETCSVYAYAGAMILIAVGAREPVAKSTLDLLSEGFLNADAAMVVGILDVLGLANARAGNLITGPVGHQLLVLSGCSSFSNLSFALLAWFALSRFLLAERGERPLGHRDFLVMGGLGVAIIGLNAARLVVMALGPGLYAFFHNGMGVYVLEAVQLFLVGGAVYATLHLCQRRAFLVSDRSIRSRA